MNAAAVTSHYSTGGLLDRMLGGLRAAGNDTDALTVENLAPAEHFHTGGAASTASFIAQLDAGPETHVLDIGCGVGGVSRAIAHTSGARVTGIDLTPDFVETATALSRLVGLEAKTEFHIGSATDLPMSDRFFDMCVMVHVGMNIEDKAAIFAEAFRVLRPGGQMGVFDVMAGHEPGAFDFPVPWASSEDTSFVVAPAKYRDAAADAGFAVTRIRNLRDAFLARLGAEEEVPDPGPFGTHLMMGATYRDKVRNYNAAVRAGRIAPVEMFFTRPI